MKLAEICDLAATVCVRESDAICCRAHTKVTDIEAVTVDGKFILKAINSVSTTLLVRL